MATMTKQSKKSSGSDLTCKWCNKPFSNERRFTIHLCPKKKRWADRDATHIRLGYRVYQKFYSMTTNGRDRTHEDFIHSPYYEGFVKFGRCCVVNQYNEPERFCEWLIRNSIKLDDWCKNDVYDRYLLEFVQKEPGLRALERTIIYMSEWAEETSTNWQDYFIMVTTPRAVHDIRSGRVSPWVLYLSNTGDQLLTRMSDEQVRMIERVIDAQFWLKMFAKHNEEVQEIRHACEIAGL